MASRITAEFGARCRKVPESEGMSVAGSASAERRQPATHFVGTAKGAGNDACL